MNHPTEDEVKALLAANEPVYVQQLAESWLALRREADEKLSEGAMIGRLSAGERIRELEALLRTVRMDLTAFMAKDDRDSDDYAPASAQSHLDSAMHALADVPAGDLDGAEKMRRYTLMSQVCAEADGLRGERERTEAALREVSAKLAAGKEICVSFETLLQLHGLWRDGAEESPQT